MTDDLIFQTPTNQESIIKVIGVGGGGTNAVKHMYNQGIKDVDFVVCDTDLQVLRNSPIPIKIQLGQSLTEGRGSGNEPEQGRQSAIESLEDIVGLLEKNTRMVFVTAGIGGGTGTGAAPIIAEAAKDMGILTVGIVTIPFRFEGPRRMKQAVEGIAKMEEHVDSLLIINNEKIRDIYGNQKITEAFAHADNVLANAAKGIAEIITISGYINVDFADVRTIMQNSGVALMGQGVAEGEDRAKVAVKEALTSPLLNNNDIIGARNVLLNITSSAEHEVSMDEVTQITEYLQDMIGDSADMIWGVGKDDGLEKRVNVTVIATGFHTDNFSELSAILPKRRKKTEEVEDPQFKGEPRVKEEEPKKKESENEEKLVIKDKNKAPVKPPDPEMEKQKRKKFRKLQEMGYGGESADQLDELENVPAYKRRNFDPRDKSSDHDQDFSNLSVGKGTGNQLRISDDNSFFHDNVD